MAKTKKKLGIDDYFINSLSIGNEALEMIFDVFSKGKSGESVKKDVKNKNNYDLGISIDRGDAKKGISSIINFFIDKDAPEERKQKVGIRKSNDEGRASLAWDVIRIIAMPDDKELEMVNTKTKERKRMRYDTISNIKGIIEDVRDTLGVSYTNEDFRRKTNDVIRDAYNKQERTGSFIREFF